MVFKKPDFSSGEIEMRYEDGELLIYATETGLEELTRLCKQLIENPGQGHIHLEDYEILTDNSLKGVIGIFRSKN